MLLVKSERAHKTANEHTLFHVHVTRLVLLHGQITKLITDLRQQEQRLRLTQIPRRCVHIWQPQLQICCGWIRKRIGKAARCQNQVFRIAQPTKRIETTEDRFRCRCIGESGTAGIRAAGVAAGAGGCYAIGVITALHAFEETRSNVQASAILQECFAGAFQLKRCRSIEWTVAARLSCIGRRLARTLRTTTNAAAADVFATITQFLLVFVLHSIPMVTVFGLTQQCLRWRHLQTMPLDGCVFSSEAQQFQALHRLPRPDC